MDKFRELEIICESENTLEALLKSGAFHGGSLSQ